MRSLIVFLGLFSGCASQRGLPRPPGVPPARPRLTVLPTNPLLPVQPTIPAGPPNCSPLTPINLSVCTNLSLNCYPAVITAASATCPNPGSTILLRYRNNVHLEEHVLASLECRGTDWWLITRGSSSFNPPINLNNGTPGSNTAQIVCLTGIPRV